MLRAIALRLAGVLPVLFLVTLVLFILLRRRAQATPLIFSSPTKQPRKRLPAFANDGDSTGRCWSSMRASLSTS